MPDKYLKDLLASIEQAQDAVKKFPDVTSVDYFRNLLAKKITDKLDATEWEISSEEDKKLLKDFVSLLVQPAQDNKAALKAIAETASEEMQNALENGDVSSVLQQAVQDAVDEATEELDPVEVTESD